MKEISPIEMSELLGGFAPLAPDPPMPNPSVSLQAIMRALANLWPNPLVVGHEGYAD